MDYSDYFAVQHHPDEVSMDELIAEAMCTDMELNDLKHVQALRITLKNELLTCYEFLKQRGLLQEYHIYRDGYPAPNLPV